MGKFVKGDVVIVHKIFTADKNIILSVAGHLNENKISDVLNAIITIISS